jgi:hypothetical protein
MRKQPGKFVCSFKLDRSNKMNEMEVLKLKKEILELVANGV